METSARYSHPKAAILNVNVSPSKYNGDSSYNNRNLPVQIRLPLQKPNYRPSERIKVKPSSRKSNPRPVTTTSDILRLMDSLKLPVPLDIYALLVKECTELGDPLKAIELHKHVRRSGLRLNLTFLNRLLLMYVSSGCVGHARQLFDQMSVRDVNSWAVVFAGLVENGEYNAVKDLFTRMLCEAKFENVDYRQQEISISGILIFVLKGCLFTKDLELGRQLHGWLLKMGYSRSIALDSFLINFYGKLNCLEDAQSVFEQIGCRNTVVWTSRIVNCCSDGNFEEAVSVFKEMGREGVRKNGYTFSSMLKACGKIEDIWCGRQVHASVMKLGLESDDFVQCALVDLYGKCGILKDATRMFEMGGITRNSASCNAILSNYTQNGLCTEAMKILYEMNLAGLKPNESLFTEVNFVCGSLS